MLKKIDVEHLRTGMHLHELCGSWMEHPFWRTKFVIQDENDIRLIVDSGIKEVWIDDEKGLDVAVASETKEEVEADVDQALLNAAVTGTPRQVQPPKQVRMAEEVERAARICAESSRPWCRCSRKCAWARRFQVRRQANWWTRYRRR